MADIFTYIKNLKSIALEGSYDVFINPEDFLLKSFVFYKKVCKNLYETNLTFYQSVLYCLDNDFFKKNNQQNIIYEFIEKSKSSINNNFVTFKYGASLKKKSLTSNLSMRIINNDVIKYIGDCLNINIYIIYEKDIMYVGEDNITRKSIILSKTEDKYEPLIHNGITIFDVTSKIIQFLISNNFKIKKDNTFSNEDKIMEKLTQNSLSKLKIEEIRKLAKDLNIILTHGEVKKKPKTKQILIDEILLLKS